jgi:hypothetical protein
MNDKIHWLTLPSQRSDIGSPKIIGFIRTASQLHKFFQVLTIKIVADLIEWGKAPHVG